MKRSLYLILVVMLLGLSACDGLPVAGAQTVPTQTAIVPLVQDSGGVIAEGNIVPRDWVRIYTRTGGEVVEVLVKEGDTVAQGAVILRLGDLEAKEAALAAVQLEVQASQKALDDLNNKAALAGTAAQAALAEAQKALVDAQQALDDFDSSQYQTDLDNLRKTVNTTRDDLEDAQEEFEKYKDMDSENADRKRADTSLKDAQKKYDDADRKLQLKINEMEQKKAAEAAALAQRDDAQHENDQRKNGADPAELGLVEARLNSAQAQVKAAEDAILDLELRAPLAGMITDLDVVVGEMLLPNQPAAQIADTESWYVETNDLTEMEVVRVSEGQTATIAPDALQDLNLAATVESIGWEAGRKGGDVTYTVRLKLDESDARLRWGMTVEVRFER